VSVAVGTALVAAQVIYDGLQKNRQIDPRAAALGQSIGKNSNEAKLFEAIFTDSANTMAIQNNVDQQYGMQNNMNMNMGYGINTIPQNQYGNYYNQMPQSQFNAQPPQMMPPYQPQMLNGYPQNQNISVPAQQPNGDRSNPINRLVYLAFNSPIKNRPDSEGGLGSRPAGPAGKSFGSFD
jgi:hypothetical protein